MAEAGGARPRPLRVALYSGLFVRHDAISSSLRLKLAAIDKWKAAGIPIEAVAFVHASDCDDPRVRCLRSVSDLLRIPDFRAADIHVFEFGIHYPLFDAVFLLPDHVPAGAVYHNITPPHLADDPESRAVLERSLVQRHNLSRMAHVASVSEYSRRELVALGFPPERLSVIPLPPVNGPPVRRPRGPGRDPAVELLYVGRFVRAKGVIDLLQAVSLLVGAGRSDFRLTLAGNPGLSSSVVLAEMEEWCSRSEMSKLVRIVPAPDDDLLAELYARADVFVIPSYHEGYCIPVLEALAAGCQVVAYDSSNLPFLLGGLGVLVETSAVTALAAALGEAIGRVATARASGESPLVRTARGDMVEEVWRREVAVHLAAHSATAFEAGFAALLGALATEIAGRAAGEPVFRPLASAVISAI